jgi:hypothetical protein
MEDIALEGELLDYFNQFVEWITCPCKITVVPEDFLAAVLFL